MPYADTRGDWSQRNQRISTDFTDQHGRKYHATIEIKSGDPCGLIEPLFQAPVMPPQQFLKRVPRRPYDIVIDYDGWKREIRAAWAEWQSDGRAVGMKLHGSAYDPSADFTFDILQVIGPAPTRIEPVLACQQGNKWALGLSSRVDMRLVPYLEPEQVDPDYSDPIEDDFGDVVAEKYEDLDDDYEETPQHGAKTDRNAAIVAQFDAGVSVTKLTEMYGVSDARVRQIIKKASEKAAV